MKEISEGAKQCKKIYEICNILKYSNIDNTFLGRNMYFSTKISIVSTA